MTLCLFLALKEHNSDVETDKKANVEVTEGLPGLNVSDLENLRSALPKPETQEHIEKKARAEFKEGLSGWSVDDLANLQSVQLWPKTQEDIDKIGKITSLKVLDISVFKDDKEMNWDLEAISGLENLEELRITGENSELNTEPLAKLKNVRILHLEETEFDMSFLSGMESLEELYTERTGEIEDISMIAGLEHLRILDIYYVNTADLCLLKDLEELEEIEIATSNIYGFGGLENLHKVKRLQLKVSLEGEEEPYMDMSVLENMKGLKALTIGGIKTGNIQSLTELESLEWLILVDTGVEDIEPLCNMPNLENLGIYGNKSKVVEKQREQYEGVIWDLRVSDEIPFDFQF